MTANPYFECGYSQWSLSDLKYEGVVGEKMSDNFSLELDGLPHHMADLLGRLRDRERSSALNSWGGMNSRLVPRRNGDDNA